MKLLVTGALGHIGSKLIRAYSNREDIETIRILDNLSTERYCSLFHLPDEKRYEFIEGDINNSSDLEKSLEGIDTVIHLAAITNAPSTIKKPELTYQVNFEGTIKVLNASKKHGVKKFLFPSTTSVYGEASGLVDENFEDYKPCTPYAEAKLKAEAVVEEAGKSGKIDTDILRMGTIFGTSIGMRFHTAVNKFTYLACMNKPITVWEEAYNQKRPYLGINDNVRAFEFLEKNGKSGELYNVLTANYTVKEIVDSIRKFIPDLEIKTTNSPIINQKSYEVSNEKIRNLGFKFEDNLEKEIEKTINLFRAVKNEKL